MRQYVIDEVLLIHLLHYLEEQPTGKAANLYLQLQRLPQHRPAPPPETPPEKNNG